MRTEQDHPTAFRGRNRAAWLRDHIGAARRIRRRDRSPGIGILIKTRERGEGVARGRTGISHRGAENRGRVVFIRGISQETLIKGGIRYVEGGGDQGIDVNLGSATKNDAVLVDQIDLSVGFDRAQDLTGHTGRVENPIQCDPVVGPVLRSRALIEIGGSVLADVKRLPGQDCLGRGLRDGDRSLAVGGRLGWKIGVLPQG